MARCTVTCEGCGHRMAIARSIDKPERIKLICHECEAALTVVVTKAELAEALKPRKVAAAG